MFESSSAEAMGAVATVKAVTAAGIQPDFLIASGFGNAHASAKTGAKRQQIMDCFMFLGEIVWYR